MPTSPISTGSPTYAVTNPVSSKPHPVADKLTTTVLNDFKQNIEARLIQTFNLASEKMLPGIAVHHLLLGTFLKCTEEAFQRSGIDLNNHIPPNLDEILREAFTAMMNDPVHGKGRREATRLKPDDFFPDANSTLEFMRTGFRHTPMEGIPEKQLWRLCVNQNRVAQLAELGIDMSKSALAPFLTDGEPRFCLSVLKALRYAMDNQHKRTNLDFIKNLHKKLNAAGSGNMEIEAAGGSNLNANLKSLGSSKAAEFDTMSKTGFNLIVDNDSLSECIAEIKEFEKDVQIDLRRFKAEYKKVGDKTIFGIDRPFCSPKTLDKIANRWLDDYHKKIEDDPANGVRHAVVLCQNIGRLHGFQNGNGRLCHTLLNHFLAQQYAANPTPELAASKGMVALNFKSILCSSYDAMTASVKKAQLDFSAACSQQPTATVTPPARKMSPIQAAYLSRSEA